MIPFLASNFGNLYAFLLGVPGLILAFVLAVVAGKIRIRALRILAGIICFAVATLFLSSLDQAVEDDRRLTLGISVIAGVVGIVFVATNPRPESHDQHQRQS